MKTRATNRDPFNPGQAHEDLIVAQLRKGENVAALTAMFGTDEYRELQQLAQVTPVDGAGREAGRPRVLILPGMMGSTLGALTAKGAEPLWLDPARVVAGQLPALALPGGAALRPLGVLHLPYLKLLLMLRNAGFTARFHPYDWRLGLDELGRELAGRLAESAAEPVHLVAHSMGGLIVRTLLGSPTGRRIGRFIQIGTPNRGSFASLQALRGTYPSMRKLAALDASPGRQSADELARRVFHTLPGLYHLLPEEFLAADRWPDDFPPDRHLLAAARRARARLADADERCFALVGVGQETVIGARRSRRGELLYRIAPDGDGTVSRRSALWAGARTWSIQETHGRLAANPLAAVAITDLLRTGDTRILPRLTAASGRTRARASAAAAPVVTREVSESALRASVAAHVQWDDLSPATRRCLLEPVVQPEFLAPGNRGSRLLAPGQRAPILELRLACGSITAVTTPALALGVYRGVDPGGAAAAVDALLGGAIRDSTLRRMFSGQRGEVFTLPSGDSPLPASLVLLAGLGDFDRFDAAAQRFVAENVVRTLQRSQLDQFATVLYGTGSGVDVASALANQLQGYLASAQHLRRITLVEQDPRRCAAIQAALERLSTTQLFDGVDVVFDRVTLPAPPAPSGPGPAPQGAVIRAGRGAVAGHRRRTARVAYLIVAEDGSTTRELRLRASLLTAGAKAAVLTAVKPVARRAVRAHLQRIAHTEFNARRLAGYGEVLGALLLHRDILAGLRTVRSQHLVVVHDALAASYPWETLAIDGRFPAAEAGLSRRYAADHLSVARWSESRNLDTTLDVLLIVNPTGDLAGADREGARLRALVAGAAQSRGGALRLTELRGAEATRPRIIESLQRGGYDVMHFCGHAFHDAARPERSGLHCAGGDVLTGPDLSAVAELPALMFFNACEAARVPAGRRFSGQTDSRLRRNVSLAEAILRGGVANYLGTYWPVGDREADLFSRTFYRGLLRGESLAEALGAARQAVRRLSSVDWADYLHYGNPAFRLRM